MMRLRSIWTRLLSLSVVVALIVPVLVVPASAASAEGSATVQINYKRHNMTDFAYKKETVTIPRSGDLSILFTIEPNVSSGWCEVAPEYFQYESSVSGAVGFYVSMYARSEYQAMQNITAWVDPSDWLAEYVDNNGVTRTVSTIDVDTFAPTVTNTTVGIAVSFNIDFGDISVTDLTLKYTALDSSTAQGYLYKSNNDRIFFYVPSFTIVAAETSAQLDALEEMADQIAQQNQLLQAMYGDIISLLQSIYTNTGDMEAALNLANQYLVSMSTYLQGILSKTDSIYQIMSTYMHYLQDISETADDIYAEFQSFHSDFLSKMSELVGVIQDESDDIQAKMEDIYQRLIAWLNSQFSSAANPGLSGNSQTVSGNIQQSNTISSQYTGSMTSQFSSLNLGSFAFATNMVTALTFVSTLWTSFYDNAGDYKIIILLPMYIGICLLVVGMARKLANRGGGGKG